jgi:hypothetical protein
MSKFTPMVEVLQPGKLGEAEIKHYTVTRDLSMISALRGRGEYCPEGSYAQLFVRNYLVMSDTLMERNTNWQIVREATGHTFIAGLGLGMILVPILRKPEVTKVTVIEKSQDVIDLVLPQLRAYLGADADKLEVICADILVWLPPKGWKVDVVYFDIWADICVDNIEEIIALHRRFARRKTHWMNSWCYERLKSHKRQEKSRRWY